jgi:hypothetical protein
MITSLSGAWAYSRRLRPGGRGHIGRCPCPSCCEKRRLALRQETDTARAPSAAHAQKPSKTANPRRVGPHS